MGEMRGWVLAIGISIGCYSPAVAPGLPCAENGSCPEGQMCIAGTCELSGTDAPIEPDAMIDACPTATCSGNDIVGCGAPVTCDTGCSIAGGAHCRELVPSNGITTTLLAGVTTDVVVGDDWHFHADTGEIFDGANVLRIAGPGVIAGIRWIEIDGMGVFVARSWSVGVNDRWNGDGTNTIALYAATTITVVGRIDVGADNNSGGPGGSSATSSMSGSSCRGRAGRFFAAGFGEGGGGGGGRGAGANGGDSNMGASAGLGGIACSERPLTTPLRGGVGGGHGGASFENYGGGGGGALALVAMESITISGHVGAPGEGGSAAAPGVAGAGDGGGGGGGGGAVLVEAPLVTISGSLTANGGGGAAPTMDSGARGYMTSGSTASGGSFTGPGGTSMGGRGGANTTGPTVGQTYIENNGALPPLVTITRGGGGGGAAGRTEIKSLMRTTTGATLSPPPLTTDATLQ